MPERMLRTHDRARLSLLLLGLFSVALFVHTRWRANVVVDVCSHKGLVEHARCVRQGMDAVVDLYRTFEAVVAECEPHLCTATLHRYANRDESKYAYPPAADRVSPLLVTLGIGDDIEAELKWRTDYPLTRFVGADPFERTGKVYDTFGQWHAVGVSGVDGVVRSSAIGDSGHYEIMNLTTITLSTLMTRANMRASTTIDQLWMDSEGGEYSLLPLVVFANATTRVCQMNVELHGPSAHYGLVGDFDAFVRSVFGEESKMGVVKHSTAAGHHRLAVVNVRDEECRHLYDIKPRHEA